MDNTRKRGVDGEEKDQQKRMKVSDIEVSLIIRCLIDTKKAGVLIGRGGAVINSFREQSGAWVDISATVPGATKRVMSVKGNLQTCCVALTMICARLAESRQENFERNQDPSGEADDITIEFLIGAGQAGAIIGKGGSNINQLRQETGCRIKISSECLPMSTEKTVNVRGPHAAVSAATQRIVTGLNDVADRPARQPYLPQPEMNQAFASYYGLQQLGAMHPNQQAAMYGYGQVPGMGGMQQQQHHHQQHHQQQHHHQQPQGEEQTLMLPVPEAMMGGVIGRRGAHINEVRQRSGARIKIPQSDRNQQERMLTITGTPQANELAIALIHQKMAEAQLGRT